MVKCWICNQEMEGVGYNDDNFIHHLEAEHVKLEIGVSKNNEVQTV